MVAIITINRMSWAVFFVDKSHSALTDDSGEQNAYGITIFREGEIYIDSALPNGLMRQTVTHELIHAIAFSYNVDLEYVSEEVFCKFIAAHFDELKSLRKAVLKAH